MDESHIEHTVGFIEDEELDMPKIDESLLHEIEEATWSCYEDIDSLREGIDLTMLSDSSEYYLRPEIRIATIVREALLDLDREFASRREDESPDRSFSDDFPIFLVHVLDDRKSKRCSFSRTCLCDSEKIPPCKDEWDGFLLYRSRGSIAFFGECFQNRIDQMEFGKEHESVRKEKIEMRAGCPHILT